MAFCVLGLLMTVLIPPFQVPDEAVHWTAAYSRSLAYSGGDAEQNKCSLANGLVGVFEPGRIAFHPHEKVHGRQFRAVAKMQPVCSEDTLNYGIVSTYPGVLAARAITTGEGEFPNKAFQVFLLGRFLQGALLVLLAWRVLTVSFQSGRLLPGTLVMTAGMVAPLFVQQSFSMSADVVTFALSLSLIFFLFHMPRARWFDWAMLVALSVTVGATKPPLFPAIPAFLYVGLARARAELGERRWITSLTWSYARVVHLCVIAALVAALWISSQQPVSASSQPGGGGDNVQRQIEYILQNRSVAINMLMDSAWSKFTSWEPFVGTLGWLDAPMSGWTQKRYQHLLFLAFFVDVMWALLSVLVCRDRALVLKNLVWKLPINFALVLCLFLVGLCTTLILYLTWTPVGAGSVAGLQARYFLPMLLPFPLLVGDLFSVGKSEVPSHGGASRLGTVGGVVTFGVMALLLLFPLYLDLILRWW